MKPVYQTVFTKGDGNCYPACLASILELELSEVPLFTDSDWWLRYREWLRPLNLSFLTMPLSHEREGLDDWYLAMPGYTIIAVQSPGIPDCLHAVVALDGKVVHDPNPRYSDHVYSHRECIYVDVLLTLDPSKSVPR